MNSYKKRQSLILVFLVNLLILVGGTFAWFTGKDERVNRVDAPDGEIKIKIEGQLTPLILSPGLTVKREVVFRNESQQSVFVRASLNEVLASFEVDTTDQTGNAHLKNYIHVQPPVTPSVSLTDDTTWVKDTFYQANKQELFKISDVSFYKYEEGSTATKPLDFQPIHLTMGKVFDTFQADKTNYWLYKDGFFYYSEPILPTNTTGIFVDKISLATDTPNRLKGSLYNNSILVDGVVRNDTVYDAWEIPKNPSNAVYQLLSKHL